MMRRELDGPHRGRIPVCIHQHLLQPGHGYRWASGDLILPARNAANSLFGGCKARQKGKRVVGSGQEKKSAKTKEEKGMGDTGKG
jgi:hypothetical protein